MANHWIIFLAGVLVGGIVGACIAYFVFSLCRISYHADESLGVQEWQVKS